MVLIFSLRLIPSGSLNLFNLLIKSLGNNLNDKQLSKQHAELLNKLSAYYAHQQEQLKGFEKDPNKLQTNLKIIDNWISDIGNLIKALS